MLANGGREGTGATPATPIVVGAAQPVDGEDMGSSNATTPSGDESSVSTRMATTPRAIGVRAEATDEAPGPRLANAAQIRADPSIDVQISDPLTDSPVALDLPSIVALGGADVAVGPDGVQTSGARTFAQSLLARAHDRDPDVADDPALRQIAESELMNQLALAELTGMPHPARLVRGSVIVQIEVVGPLTDTHSAALRLPSSRSVPAVGLAVGVVQRAEPGYLPDLVTVAAVAYR